MIKTPTQRKKEDPIQQQLITTQSAQQAPEMLTSMKPTMFVVGDTLKSNEISQELKTMGIHPIKTRFIKDLKHKFKGSELGIIYVTPLKRGDLLSVHKNLKKLSRFKKIPCFAVVPEWVNGQRERTLYQSGIRMIFEWPREKRTFSQVLTTAILSGTEKVVSDDSDKSLGKAIENRMSGEFGYFAPDFTTTIYNGIVMLRGKVNSVSKKRELVNKIKKVPGVRGVIDESLSVLDTHLPPQLLRKTANDILSEFQVVDTKTMIVTVDRADNQKLLLSGTASSPEATQIVKKRLEKIHGVKGVKANVTSSSEAHKKDSNLAWRAQRVAKKLTIGSRGTVSVRVANGEAYIRGEVQSPIEKKHLTKAIEGLEGVSMVYNLVELHPFN